MLRTLCSFFTRLALRLRTSNFHASWHIFEITCPVLSIELPSNVQKYQYKMIQRCVEQFSVAFRPSGYCFIDDRDPTLYVITKISITLHELKKIQSLSIEEVNIIMNFVARKVYKRKSKGIMQKIYNAKINGHELMMMTDKKLADLGFVSLKYQRHLLDRIRELTICGYPICKINCTQQSHPRY